MEPKKILIVEDDESIAELQKDYLEVAGYDVKIESNGRLGLLEALHNDFDLVVLDINLPELTGFEICKSLREQKDTPVLLVTAKATEIDKIKGLSLGADDYITKPFSFNEFVARVKAHITRYDRLTQKANQGQPAHKTIHVDGLLIDLDAHRVYVEGTEVALANKEYDLLVFLAQNPNKVYNRDKLMDKIWGYESFTDTATVTVHIKRIREKIEKDIQNPKYIETVWGAGYRFKM